MTLHDNFVCDVCGKRRSLWNRRNLHTKCSKIRQARFNDNTGKALQDLQGPPEKGVRSIGKSVVGNKGCSQSHNV